MGVLTSIVAGVFALGGAVVVALLKDEAVAYMPKMIRWVLSAAVRRVPEADRERYAEEWAAHVSEYPGKLSQIFQALKCLKAGMEFEEFDAEFLRKKARNFIAIGSITMALPIVTDLLQGRNFWLDHLIGFANFYSTVVFVWTAYWMIRLRPHITKLGGSQAGDR